jgi:ribosomal protein L37AE/L43A
MSDDKGMNKYGVELDDTVKKAEVTYNKPSTCPWCGKALRTDGTCPEHGTEPFEAKERK